MALSADFWSSAAKLVPSVVSMFTSNRETGAEKQQRQALARQQELIAAANDPSSQIYKNQVAVDEAGRKSDYAKSIQELINAQRRQTYMGRNPLLDPERADETLSRLENQASTQAARDARINATNTILSMANAQGGLAGSYGGMVGNAQERSNNRGAQISTLINDLVTRGTGGASKTNPEPSAQDIVWNTPRQMGQVVVPSKQVWAGAPSVEGSTILGSLMGRNSGGQNTANTMFNQTSQRSGTRANKGGRMFG